MKTSKIMKNLYVILLSVLFISVGTFNLMGQDKEKEVKIKVIKEENGKKIVIDTTINMSELESLEDNEELKKILESEGLSEFDFDMDDIEDLDVKVMHYGEGEGEQEKIMVIKKKSGEDGDVEVEKEYMVTVLKSDSIVDGKKIEMHLGESGYGYFITDDDEIHEINMEGGEQTIIVKKKIDGDDEQIFIGEGEDMEWYSEDSKEIKVIDSEDGKKVIVMNEDGTEREYDIEEGKGNYIIGEDGELKKLDKDVNWVTDEGDMEMITVTIDDDGETMLIKSDGTTIDLEDFDKSHNVFIHKSDGMDEDHDVFIEVIEKKEGDKIVHVKSKIIVCSVSEDEKESLEKSGLTIDPSDEEKLEIEGMGFHPNPTNGKFTLKFSTPETGNTEIAIYDINGKQVYYDKIKNFDGKYKKEIDISAEKKGTYFLKITQGKKFNSKKIVLE